MKRPKLKGGTYMGTKELKRQLLGLLEMDVFADVEPVEVKKYTFTAYCDSDSCLKKFKAEIQKGMGVKKDIPKTAIDCPDCNHALFWDKKVA
jgi:hypothetical protein